jgi:hypothetical protein
VATDDDSVTAPPAPPRVDVVVPRAPTEDRTGVHVVRLRNTPAADPGCAAPTDNWVVEAGEMRPMAEGQPLNGAELVTLKPREDVPAFDVDVVMPRGTQPQLSGPPQVATEQYRKNWSETFGDAETFGDDDPNLD